MQKINGRYYAYFYDKNRTPERKSFALGFSRKTPAQKYYRRIEEAYGEGTFDPWLDDPWIDGERVTPIPVKEAIEKFLDAKRKENRRPATIDTYQQQLGAWRKTLPIGITTRDLISSHLTDYIRDAEVVNATKRKRYGHLRAFLNWCEENRYLEKSPLGDVTQPKRIKKEQPTLDPEDIDTLIQAIDEHESTTDAVGRSPDVQWLKDTIVITMYTGLRRAEIVSVLWQDIDLKAKTLSVRSRSGAETKTGDERTVPLRGPALTQVQAIQGRRTSGEALDGDSHLIQDRNEKEVRPDRVTKRFKFFVRKADLDDRISFHTLRHSFTSYVQSKGVPTRMAQEILGHSSITTTERYSHMRLDDVADELDRAFGDN